MNQIQQTEPEQSLSVIDENTGEVQTYKKRTSIFVKAAVAVFAAFAVIMIFSQLYRFTELELKKQKLEKQIYEAQEGIAQLQEQLDEEMDDAYIERIARSMLNYHLPEEILFFNDLIN